MQKILHKAEDRGVAEHEWLHSRFSFSFADWYEPSRMGFGALRVINDDIIDPASGFGMHPHKDMEIITIVTEGAVTHEDSMGNRGIVPAGDVQVMSAGTGVVHSEYNESPAHQLALFQIWIQPKTRGIEPHYAQASFGTQEMNTVQTLVSPRGTEGLLMMNQDAYVSRAHIDAGQSLNYSVKVPGNGVYIFVVSGAVQAGEELLAARDALGLSGEHEYGIHATAESHLLIFEVPL